MIFLGKTGNSQHAVKTLGIVNLQSWNHRLSQTSKTQRLYAEEASMYEDAVQT